MVINVAPVSPLSVDYYVFGREYPAHVALNAGELGDSMRSRGGLVAVRASLVLADPLPGDDPRAAQDDASSLNTPKALVGAALSAAV
jgi:hypothetical protein